MQQETLTQGDYKVTLFLNPDRSVVMSQKMTVSYPVGGKEVTKEVYPSEDTRNNQTLGYATISEQFKLVETLQRLDEVVERRGGAGRGQGRKPIGETPKVAFPVSRVASDVAAIVRKHDNMTEFVEGAIRAHHKPD